MTARLAPCRKCGNRPFLDLGLFDPETGKYCEGYGVRLGCEAVYKHENERIQYCRNSAHGKDKKQASARWNYLQTVERPKTGRHK